MGRNFIRFWYVLLAGPNKKSASQGDFDRNILTYIPTSQRFNDSPKLKLQMPIVQDTILYCQQRRRFGQMQKEIRAEINPSGHKGREAVLIVPRFGVG